MAIEQSRWKRDPPPLGANIAFLARPEATTWRVLSKAILIVTTAKGTPFIPPVTYVTTARSTGSSVFHLLLSFAALFCLPGDHS